MKARLLLLFIVQLLSILLCQSAYHPHKIGDYIRHCKPIFDCQPGYEVHPCEINHTEDLCQKCPEGLVQPDVTPVSNITDPPRCFSPRGNCEGYDIKHSREPYLDADCQGNCQCKTEDCYYGDPCHCGSRAPCDVNKTMNKKGECIPCPPGTSKKKKGCGPCLHIKSSPHKSTTKQSTISSTKSTTTSTSVNGSDQRITPDAAFTQGHPGRSLFTSTKKPLQGDRNKTKENVNNRFQDIQTVQNNTHKGSIHEGTKDNSQTKLLVGIVITLSILVIVGIIAVVVLFCRRPTIRDGDEEVQAEGDNLINQNQEDGCINNVQPEMEIHMEQQEQNSSSNSAKPDANMKKSRSESACAHSKMYPNLESPTASSLEDEIIKMVDKQEKCLLPSHSKTSQPKVCKTPESGITNVFKGERSELEEIVHDSKWFPKTAERTFKTQLSVPLDQNNGLQNKSMQKTSSLPTTISNTEDGRADLQNYNIPNESRSIREDGFNDSNSSIDFSSPCDLDLDSFTPGHTQVTDVHSTPVAQETEPIIRVNLSRAELMTSGLGSSISDGDFPLQSPMSIESKEPDKQEYGYLVSVSEGNTGSIISSLAEYNFSLVGNKRSITEPKHLVSNTSTDSGVYNSTREN